MKFKVFIKLKYKIKNYITERIIYFISIIAYFNK